MAKTFRVTGTGKLMRRKAGQAHFNARENGNTTKNKRRDLVVGRTSRRIKEVINI
ncbi:MAG: 50S ribosomal protein L35 [Candidatus Doudnabacteria bacterium]|nr:50S ribosomal protein L35 [Candidatus Doudnabacteria bacterium]